MHTIHSPKKCGLTKPAESPEKCIWVMQPKGMNVREQVEQKVPLLTTRLGPSHNFYASILWVIRPEGCAILTHVK